MSYVRAWWQYLSSRVLMPLRAVTLAGMAGVLVVVTLALAFAAGPALGAASAAAHPGHAVHNSVAFSPSNICPPAPQPC